MIIVKIQAGLGNQMFMYAAAWALQQKCGDKVYAVYDIDGKKTNRKLSINNTGADLFPDCPVLLERVVYHIKKWEQKINHRDLDDYDDVKEAFEDGFCCSQIRRYIDADMSKARIKYLSGTFLSAKYFQGCESEIRAMFRISTPPNRANVEMRDKILNVCESVCLHIRMGDYQLEKYRRFQICTEDYYKRAIYEMLEVLERNSNKKSNFPTFFIFTENHDVVKKWNLENECGDRASICYVDLDNPDYEELRLMYLCKHFILSNSTFSWWAQYLSNNEDKIVIAPNKWLNGEDSNPIDLYEDNWICIDT